MPSQAEIEQFQRDIAELSALAVAEATAVLSAVTGEDVEDPQSLVSEIVDTVEPFMIEAAEQAVEWYRELGSREPSDAVDGSARPAMTGPSGRIASLDAADFVPRPAVAVPREQIESSVWWALSVPVDDAPQPKVRAPAAQPNTAGQESFRAKVVQRLSGVVQRYVTTAARDTLTDNAAREGVRWVRHAKADACAFCRMLATRGPDPATQDYRTSTSAKFVVGRRGPRGKRALGEKYHDECECEPVPIRAGDSYALPDYAAEWELQFAKARANTNGSAKAMLAWMRADDKAHGGPGR